MKRILIANRGEIARRVIHTANAMGIDTVAVYSEPDAHALHVREATTRYALGGTTSAESYLDIGKLLQAAKATGADAVHPGYGFLSENAGFAKAVQDAGLTWIGPPPQAIEKLGSKSSAKALARASHVPCLPGYDGPDESDDLLASEAARIGYPVMIKAVAGGGGRGMRLVAQPADFVAALRSARSEALAGFGSAEVLIERALLAPRHVEVQVFADQHGHCIHLGERDCSVQRRNQKIIEESPSPAVDATMRGQLGACAVALAQAAGYVGAGTVEFLVEGGEFFLMEMNTRLQVEHPVTEALCGFDLVEWQIRVARGEALPCTQSEVRLQGHAIEVRLCAEDETFAPRTGTVAFFSAPQATAFENAQSTANDATLRFDHAIEVGTEVSPYYDSMLGKLIVHAPDRLSAIDALIRALQRTYVLGLPTNRAFLAACLNHPGFRAGEALVPFLLTAADGLRAELAEAESAALIPATASIATQGNSATTPLPCPFGRPLRVQHRDAVHAMSLLRDRDGAIAITAGESHHMLTPLGNTRWSQAGVPVAVHAQQLSDTQWHVQTDAGAELWINDLSLESAAQKDKAAAQTELRAPFNGRVILIAAKAGDTVEAATPVVVIESMKLEHSLAMPVTTRVAEVLVEAGQQATPGQLLVRFEPINAVETST